MRNRRVRTLAYPTGDGIRTLRPFRPCPVRVRSHRHQSSDIRPAVDPGNCFRVRLVPGRTATARIVGPGPDHLEIFERLCRKSGATGEAGRRRSTRCDRGGARLHHGFHRLRLQPVHRGAVAPPATPRRHIGLTHKAGRIDPGDRAVGSGSSTSRAKGRRVDRPGVAERGLRGSVCPTVRRTCRAPCLGVGAARHHGCGAEMASRAVPGFLGITTKHPRRPADVLAPTLITRRRGK